MWVDRPPGSAGAASDDHERGIHIDIGDRPDYERNLAELRTQLGDRAFEAAWAEGQALTSEQAIALALGGDWW